MLRLSFLPPLLRQSAAHRILLVLLLLLPLWAAIYWAVILP
ncbi:hypothetical protein QE435_003527 [Rhizobium sp. SORGH_AS 787]|uniref:Uncharacterized protein n=1 Tax=Agrobacterium larrymoorei TaxID=160699 RepID=A0AAJ2BIQ1_9HYPH|nr:hypothetical protein [Agrobacterium larrymoorei]MDQ1197817.1 hypothetical protein [Rhizobium sp. SORGH_AS_0787]MDR6104463.1 hypothetical protein [Agrobacterium larrymoorei]